jgi:hypothetical protein
MTAKCRSLKSRGALMKKTKLLWQKGIGGRVSLGFFFVLSLDRGIRL